MLLFYDYKQIMYKKQYAATNCRAADIFHDVYDHAKEGVFYGGDKSLLRNGLIKVNKRSCIGKQTVLLASRNGLAKNTLTIIEIIS